MSANLGIIPKGNERMPTYECGCRLAKIEQKLADNDVAIIERRRQEDKMMQTLEDIEDKINKLHGFTAGVAATFTCIGGLIVFLWDKVLKGH